MAIESSRENVTRSIGGCGLWTANLLFHILDQSTVVEEDEPCWIYSCFVNVHSASYVGESSTYIMIYRSAAYIERSDLPMHKAIGMWVRSVPCCTYLVPKANI